MSAKLLGAGRSNHLTGTVLDRRAVMRGGVALGIALPTFTVVAGRVGAQDSITFWYATNPSETEFALQIVEAWNGSNDVQVDAQPVPSGNSTEEVVLAAIAAGTTPCVLANLAPAAVPQFGQALVNLTATFDDAEDFLISRSGEDIIDQYRSDDGDIYQIPWKVNPVMVFYNTAMFEEAGLDPEAPPQTYTEALDAMASLKDAGFTPIQPSIDQTWYNRWFDWYPLYLAAGDQLLLNDEGTEAIFNGPAGKSAMSFWRNVYENEYAPQATAQQDPYSQGEVAMRIAGPWAIPEIEQGGLLEDTAVMPVWVPDDAAPVEEMPTTFADAKNIGIFSNCDDKDSAWEFVKFYVSEEQDTKFLQITQQIPLRQGIEDSVASDERPLLQAFAAQAEHTLNVDQSPQLTDIFGIISQAYQKAAIYREASVDDALSEAEEQVNSLIGNG